MEAFLDVLSRIMRKGTISKTRTGMEAKKLFFETFRWDLASGFPLATTRPIWFRGVKAELLWFLEGEHKNGRVDHSRLQNLLGKEDTIWSDNLDAPYWNEKQFEGDLGRIYGAQWRSWRTRDGEKIDQLKKAIEQIKEKPNSRRHVVTAWNPGELDQMALPPCHIGFQYQVKDDRLNLHMTQRSADMYLGVPFNIASYALLLAMTAQVTGYEPGVVGISFVDPHIYENQFEQVSEQLHRKPKAPPELSLNPKVKDIDDFTMDDIDVLSYNPHSKLGSVAVAV